MATSSWPRSSPRNGRKSRKRVEWFNRQQPVTPSANFHKTRAASSADGFLGWNKQSGQKLVDDVTGLAKRQSQRMVRPDLFRQHPDVAETDAELIVAGAALGVLRPHLRVAERFEPLERLI